MSTEIFYRWRGRWWGEPNRSLQQYLQGILRVARRAYGRRLGEGQVSGGLCMTIGYIRLKVYYAYRKGPSIRQSSTPAGSLY